MVLTKKSELNVAKFYWKSYNFIKHLHIDIVIYYNFFRLMFYKYKNKLLIYHWLKKKTHKTCLYTLQSKQRFRVFKKAK